MNFHKYFNAEIREITEKTNAENWNGYVGVAMHHWSGKRACDQLYFYSKENASSNWNL